MTDDAARRDDPASTGRDPDGRLLTRRRNAGRSGLVRRGWIPAATAEQPAAIPRRGAAERHRSRRRPSARGAGMGQIAVAAVLSAVLASGGTVVLLQGTGALDGRGAAGTTAPLAAGQRQPRAGRRLVRGDQRRGQRQPGGRPDHRDRRHAPTSSAARSRSRGVGSGVLYDPAGWILTNRHVVEIASDEIAATLTVELKDGRELNGTVYGIDTLTDLAIVKVDAIGPARRADRQVGGHRGRPARDRDRLAARHVHEHGDDRDHLGHRANGPDRDRREPDEPHPDGRGDQSRQQRRPAARRDRRGHRDQHGGRARLDGHRLRDPDRHRPADHVPGPRRRAAGAAVRRHPLPARSTPSSRPRSASTSTTGRSSGRRRTRPARSSRPSRRTARPRPRACRTATSSSSIEGQAIDAEHPLDALLVSYRPGQTITMTIRRDGKEMDVERHARDAARDGPS